LYARFAVIRVLLLTDRTPAQVLPGAPPLLLDLKTEHLSVATVAEALALGPDAVLVDAAENPGQGHAVLHALRERGPRIPVLVVVERKDVDRFPWEEVADDVIFSGAPEGEIRLRFALTRRRTGTGEETAIRLGPIVLDPSTYRVSIEGTPSDVTFKEFELLRYLAERRGRVFTRPALLREVWGFDFYGGPAHEGLIETVRGVGYRAADV
jgi:DNA-binding response OmpR family regulator